MSLGRFGLEDPESVLARDLFFVVGCAFEAGVGVAFTVSTGVAVKVVLVAKGVSRLMAGGIVIGEK